MMFAIKPSLRSDQMGGTSTVSFAWRLQFQQIACQTCEVAGASEQQAEYHA